MRDPRVAALVEEVRRETGAALRAQTTGTLLDAVAVVQREVRQHADPDYACRSLARSGWRT